MYLGYFILILWILFVPSKSYNSESETFQVRLADGRNPFEGRVEILHAGEWGTICDDDWDNTNAGVICTMLGSTRLNATAYLTAKFGNGKGTIWLDDVVCLGNESSILDCSHADWGVNDCAHKEDVGVACIPSEDYLSNLKTTLAPAIFKMNPPENIITWEKPFTLVCFSGNTISSTAGPILWCKNGVNFMNQSIDSKGAMGWEYKVKHALTMNTGTYRCGQGHCQQSALATVHVVGAPENECEASAFVENKAGCVLNQIDQVSTQIDSIGKGHSITKVNSVIKSTINKIEILSSDGLTSSDNLDKTVDVINKIVNVADTANGTIPQQTFVTVIDHLLSTNRTSAWRNKTNKVEHNVDKILDAVSKFGNVVSKTVKLHENVTFHTENLVMTIARKPSTTSIRFPSHVDVDGSSLVLPPQTGDASSDFSYVATQFKTISDILHINSGNYKVASSFYWWKTEPSYNVSEERPPTFRNESSPSEAVVVSDVLSLTLNGNTGRKQLHPSLKMTFRYQMQENKESVPRCVYWNFNMSAEQWSEDGCHQIDTGKNFTVCQCNHLTNFAILLRPYQKNTPEPEALRWISLIGCCISILFCILTIIVFISLWRIIKSDMNLLIINLCLAIIFAYVLFAAGVERSENEVVCLIITALLQYFFLVVFFLMLDIGIYYFIHVTLVKISFSKANRFIARSRKSFFLIFAWGIPLLITGTTLGLTYPSKYHPPNICWLSFDSGALYGFIGPVAVIIVVNLVFVITLVITMYSTKLATSVSVKRKASMGIRSICTLLPVLGVTWLFGFLSVNEDVIVFQYIFAVLNSLQGFFIFLSNCIINKKVSDTIKRKVSVTGSIKTTSILTHSSQERASIDRMSYKEVQEYSQLESEIPSKKISIRKSGRIKEQKLYN